MDVETFGFPSGKGNVSLEHSQHDMMMMTMMDAGAFVDDEERALIHTHKHKWGEGKRTTVDKYERH